MSHRFDLGNMVQAVWNTAHGRFLEMTMTDGEQLNRLGAHVDPFLAALAPVWWLWPSPLLLTTVQAVALATGALPVYWLARKHTGDGRCGLFLAFAYLLFPAVQWNALNDFHPVTVAIPLLLFCVWFLDEDRPLMGALFAILAATTKEDIPLVVAGIAVWYVVRHRRWLVGGALALLGLGWALVDLYVVIPHFSGGPSPFYDRLGSVGGSPTGVVTTLVTHPLRVWDAMTTGDDLRYLGLLLVPLLFLWALEPVLALAATPVLVVSLLSDFGPMTSIRYQSVAVPVACLFAASAIGVGRLGVTRCAPHVWRGFHGRLGGYMGWSARVARHVRRNGSALPGEGVGHTSCDRADPRRGAGFRLERDRGPPFGTATYLPVPGLPRGGLGDHRFVSPQRDCHSLAACPRSIGDA
jgi:uncharacterized membrane protein